MVSEAQWTPNTFEIVSYESLYVYGDADVMWKQNYVAFLTKKILVAT